MSIQLMFTKAALHYSFLPSSKVSVGSHNLRTRHWSSVSSLGSDSACANRLISFTENVNLMRTLLFRIKNHYGTFGL